MRRLLRFLLAALLLVISMPFIVLGSYTAITVDWCPRRTLSAEELKRIVVARQHVAHQMFLLGRIPTSEEFRTWAETTPPGLRPDGVGFTYWPSGTAGSSAYDFYFWDGDATITWHSTSSDSTVGDIDPKAVFLSGSKGLDLLLFLGIAGTLLLASCLVAPAGRTANQPRSTTS